MSPTAMRITSAPIRVRAWRFPAMALATGLFVAPSALTAAPSAATPPNAESAATTPMGSLRLELVQTGESFSLDIARADAKGRTTATALMTGSWRNASSPTTPAARFSLELGEAPTSLLWYPAGHIAIGIREADGAVFILQTTSPNPDGSFSAILRDGNGRAIANMSAAGGFIVDNGDAGAGSIVWLASMLAIPGGDMRGGTPNSPNYDTCKGDAVSTCAPNNVASFKYSCNPQTGATTCEWTCHPPATK